MSVATAIPAEERGRPNRAVVLLFLMPITMVLGIGIGVGSGLRGEKLTMLLVALLTTVLSALPIVLDQARPPRQRHVLLAIVSLMYMTGFVVPVFTHYLGANGPVDPSGMEGSGILPSGILQGQLMALLGLAMLQLGYALPFGRVFSRALPTPRYEWTQRATLTAATMLIGVGWVTWALLQLGLVPFALGRGVLGGVAEATLWGSALLTIAFVRFRSPVALAFLAVLVSVTSFFNFFTGSKRRFLTPAAMIVLAWIVMRGKVRARWILLGILTLVLLYPVSQYYREVVSLYRTRSAVQVLADPGKAISQISGFLARSHPSDYLLEGLVTTGNRLDALGRAAVIVRDTPGRVPFQNGRTLALIAVAYVPRVLWPEKPDITIGQWITDNYGAGAHIDARVGPSWIGEFYLNYGTAGVVIGMLVLGLMLRTAHESFFAANRTTFTLMAGVIVLYQLLIGVGGGVVNVVNGAIFGLLPLIVAHVFVRILGGAELRDATRENPVATPP